MIVILACRKLQLPHYLRKIAWPSNIWAPDTRPDIVGGVR